MTNCRNISCKNIFRTSRMVFQGAPGEGAKPAAPTFDELSRIADAAEKAAENAPKPEDKLTKAEEQKVDDVQKKIDEKEAGGRKLNPDTKAAYDAFKEKHARYEELAKSENAVAESRKELVTYLRDILMKGGTDTALVAAYRKEAAEQKAVEEAQKKESERMAKVEKVEDSAILANIAQFKMEYVPKVVAHARKINQEQFRNGNQALTLLSFDLNGMVYDERALQTMKARPENEQARDADIIKSMEARLKKPEDWIAKYRELNQAIVLAGADPYPAFEGTAAPASVRQETAPEQKPAPAVTPAPQPKPAPPPAPKQVPPPAPEPKPTPKATPDLVAQAPATPPPAPAKPVETPVAAAKPATAPAATPSTTPSEGAKAVPAAKVAETAPGKAPQKPPASPAAPEQKPTYTEYIDRATGEKYFTRFEDFKTFLMSRYTNMRERVFRANIANRASEIITQVREGYADAKNETAKIRIPFKYTDVATNETQTHFFRIEIPNAYNNVTKIAENNVGDLWRISGIKYVVEGGGTQRGNETTVEDTNISV